MCPSVIKATLKVPLRRSGFTRNKLVRVLLLFYLITGQKPQLLIQSYSFRGIKKKGIIGFGLHFCKTSSFLETLTYRQVAVLSLSSVHTETSSGSGFSLFYKTQDDDMLAQEIKIFDTFEYNIFLATKAFSVSHMKSLVQFLKIPLSNRKGVC
jgi:hypothetical protein